MSQILSGHFIPRTASSALLHCAEGKVHLLLLSVASFGCPQYFGHMLGYDDLIFTYAFYLISIARAICCWLSYLYSLGRCPDAQESHGEQAYLLQPLLGNININVSGMVIISLFYNPFPRASMVWR